MKLNKNIEEKIKNEALEYLELRPNWDIEHTLNAVHWMRILIKNEGGNEKILIPVIYLHDTGYPKLKPGYSYQKVINAKEYHSRRGAEIAKKFLPTLKYFRKSEINIICELIKHHDKYGPFDDPELQLVYEADRLSQIDFERVKPNFNKKDCEKWLTNYWRKRKSFMKTKTSIDALKNLEQYAKKYIAQMPE